MRPGVIFWWRTRPAAANPADWTFGSTVSSLPGNLGEWHPQGTSERCAVATRFRFRLHWITDLEVLLLRVAALLILLHGLWVITKHEFTPQEVPANTCVAPAPSKETSRSGLTQMPTNPLFTVLE
jgi:hypothetical protein